MLYHVVIIIQSSQKPYNIGIIITILAPFLAEEQKYI